MSDCLLVWLSISIVTISITIIIISTIIIGIISIIISISLVMSGPPVCLANHPSRCLAGGLAVWLAGWQSQLYHIML